MNTPEVKAVPVAWVASRGPRHDCKEATVKLADSSEPGLPAGLTKLIRTLVIPVLVPSLVGGCSVAFVDGPSPALSTAGTPCTTSYAAPTLDLLGVPATFLLAFGFGGFERSLEAVGPDDDETFGNLETASLAASGVLLASGVYGLVQVRRCRASGEPAGSAPLLSRRPGDPFPGALPDRNVPAASLLIADIPAR